MSGYLFLIPLSLMLGAVGLLTFLWTLKQNQYDDLKGAGYRILNDEDFPLPQSELSDTEENQQSQSDRSSANQ